MSGRVLIVCARDPGGQATGRKVVLASIARCLEHLDFTVEAVALTRESPAAHWQGRPLHHVRLPSLARVAAGAAKALTGRGSFNEALFDSPGTRRAVSKLADRLEVDFVVADTLRVAGPAAASGRPVIAHLDDLLSDRYEARLTARLSQAPVLGYYGEQLPAPLRPAAEAVARRLLAGECRRLRRREAEVACGVAVAALTSRQEADVLASRVGCPVAALPMAVDPSDRIWRLDGAAPGSVAFLGGMGYEPNLAALRWWRDDVLPALPQEADPVSLTVIGAATEEQRREFADSDIRFLGYVEDLAEELTRHRALVAPVTEGGGIKTKVLDGLAVGMPVVSTSLGAAGTGLSDATAFLADGPAAFGAAVVAACREDARASTIGAAGRRWLQERFSTDTVTNEWRIALTRQELAPGLPTGLCG